MYTLYNLEDWTTDMDTTVFHVLPVAIQTAWGFLSVLLFNFHSAIGIRAIYSKFCSECNNATSSWSFYWMWDFSPQATFAKSWKIIHQWDDRILPTRLEQVCTASRWAENRKVKYETSWRWRRRTPKRVGECKVTYYLILFLLYVYYSYCMFMYGYPDWGFSVLFPQL